MFEGIARVQEVDGWKISTSLTLRVSLNQLQWVHIGLSFSGALGGVRLLDCLPLVKSGLGLEILFMVVISFPSTSGAILWSSLWMARSDALWLSMIFIIPGMALAMSGARLESLSPFLILTEKSILILSRSLGSIFIIHWTAMVSISVTESLSPVAQVET